MRVYEYERRASRANDRMLRWRRVCTFETAHARKLKLLTIKGLLRYDSLKPQHHAGDRPRRPRVVAPPYTPSSQDFQRFAASRTSRRVRGTAGLHRHVLCGHWGCYWGARSTQVPRRPARMCCRNLHRRLCRTQRGLIGRGVLAVVSSLLRVQVHQKTRAKVARNETAVDAASPACRAWRIDKQQ